MTRCTSVETCSSETSSISVREPRTDDLSSVSERSAGRPAAASSVPLGTTPGRASAPTASCRASASRYCSTNPAALYTVRLREPTVASRPPTSRAAITTVPITARTVPRRTARDPAGLRVRVRSCAASGIWPPVVTPLAYGPEPDGSRSPGTRVLEMGLLRELTGPGGYSGVSPCACRIEVPEKVCRV